MTAVEHPPYDLESVYDEKIAPLMSQIIAICKEHKLPMAATFQYANMPEDDENHPGAAWCTTVLTWDKRELQANAAEAAEAMSPKRHPPAMVVTTRDGDGKVVNSTVIL